MVKFQHKITIENFSYFLANKDTKFFTDNYSPRNNDKFNIALDVGITEDQQHRSHLTVTLNLECTSPNKKDVNFKAFVLGVKDTKMYSSETSGFLKQVGKFVISIDPSRFFEPPPNNSLVLLFKIEIGKSSFLSTDKLSEPKFLQISKFDGKTKSKGFVHTLSVDNFTKIVDKSQPVLNFASSADDAMPLFNLVHKFYNKSAQFPNGWDSSTFIFILPKDHKINSQYRVSLLNRNMEKYYIKVFNVTKEVKKFEYSVSLLDCQDPSKDLLPGGRLVLCVEEQQAIKSAEKEKEEKDEKKEKKEPPPEPVDPTVSKLYPTSYTVNYYNLKVDETINIDAVVEKIFDE